MEGCHTRGRSDQLIIAYKPNLADNLGPHVALYSIKYGRLAGIPSTAIVLQQDRDGIQLSQKMKDVGFDEYSLERCLTYPQNVLD